MSFHTLPRDGSLPGVLCLERAGDMPLGMSHSESLNLNLRPSLGPTSRFPFLLVLLLVSSHFLFRHVTRGECSPRCHLEPDESVHPSWTQEI